MAKIDPAVLAERSEYFAGKLARENGKSRSVCPYAAGPSRDFWVAGFEEPLVAQDPSQQPLPPQPVADNADLIALARTVIALAAELSAHTLVEMLDARVKLAEDILTRLGLPV